MGATKIERRDQKRDLSLRMFGDRVDGVKVCCLWLDKIMETLLAGVHSLYSIAYIIKVEENGFLGKVETAFRNSGVC